MNIDPALLLAAKRHALHRGTTVSDLVRTTLAREVGWSPTSGQILLDDEQARLVLSRYSDGLVSRRQAMWDLGLRAEHTTLFVEMMNKLDVAWPKLDPVQIALEADIVAEAVMGVDNED